MTAMDQAFIRAYRQQGEETMPSIAVRPAVPLSEMLGEERRPPSRPQRDALRRRFRCGKPRRRPSGTPVRSNASSLAWRGRPRGRSNRPCRSGTRFPRPRHWGSFAPSCAPIPARPSAAVGRVGAAQPGDPRQAGRRDAAECSLSPLAEKSAGEIPAAAAAAAIATFRRGRVGDGGRDGAGRPDASDAESLVVGVERLGRMAGVAGRGGGFNAEACVAAPAPWQPMLQVDHVVWPRICTQLHMVAVRQLDQLTAALAGRRRERPQGAGGGRMPRRRRRNDDAPLRCASTRPQRTAHAGGRRLLPRSAVGPAAGHVARRRLAGRLGRAAALEEAIIVSAEDRLALLPAATRPSSPQKDFALAGALDASLDELAQHYDVILVDVGSLEDCLSHAPPTLGGGSRLDAAVVVHNLRSTDAEGLAESGTQAGRRRRGPSGRHRKLCPLFLIFKGLEMYESYWQLQRRPFENNADPQFYYPGESHQAALLKLRYAVENRRGGALLAGVSGSGKTLLVNMMRTMLGDGFRPLRAPRLSPDADGRPLGLSGRGIRRPRRPGLGASVQESVRRIGRALTENAQNGRHAVLVDRRSPPDRERAHAGSPAAAVEFPAGQSAGHDAPSGRPARAALDPPPDDAIGRAAGREVSPAPLQRGGDGGLRQPSSAGGWLLAADLRAGRACGPARPDPRRRPVDQSPLRFVPA